MALQMQQQQAQQAYNSVSTNFTFPIPDDKVGIVIGKSGVTVKDLQNRYYSYAKLLCSYCIKMVVMMMMMIKAASEDPDTADN